MPLTPEESVGAILRGLLPLHETEKPVSFDPVQTAFLQRLVRESVLQAGVSIAKEDFFAGILYLDYFTEVLAGRTTLLEDVRILVSELEKMHEVLDPTLELLVRYSGIYLGKELGGERFFRPGSQNQVRARHRLTDATVSPPDANAPVDLFHRALGRMVLGLVRGPEAEALLPGVVGRNDLRATICADILLRVVPPGDEADAGRQALLAGQPLEAVLALLPALVASSKAWSLRAYVDEIKARLDGGDPA